MNPYILVLTVVSGLNSNMAPSMLRFANRDACMSEAGMIVDSVQRQAERSGMTVPPVVTADCVEDSSNSLPARK